MEEENVVRLDLDEPDFFLVLKNLKKLEYEEKFGNPYGRRKNYLKKMLLDWILMIQIINFLEFRI